MKLAIRPLVLSTAALGLMLGVAQNAQAALITGVTASTDMGTSFGDLAFTVNGAGLPGDTPSLTGTHAAASPSNAWGVLQVTGNIIFNLNGSYNLAGFSFWNFNNNNTLGINSVTVQSSTDGTNFTTITGAPTAFAIGANNAPESPEVFNFSPVTASYVQFVVNSNHGGFASAFSEVQFDGTPVPQSTPEPSSLVALLALGLAGVGLRKRI